MLLPEVRLEVLHHPGVQRRLGVQRRPERLQCPVKALKLSSEALQLVEARVFQAVPLKRR